MKILHGNKQEELTNWVASKKKKKKEGCLRCKFNCNAITGFQGLGETMPKGWRGAHIVERGGTNGPNVNRPILKQEPTKHCLGRDICFGKEAHLALRSSSWHFYNFNMWKRKWKVKEKKKKV